jgi:MerR family transcriptional regulator, thiopeptide resistance regulator
MDTGARTRAWRIGELAAAAHVSVRTLRHYDAIGLLRPAARTETGYRVYDQAGLARLYRILGLRSLGLALDEIGGLLDAGVALTDVLRRQLDAVERRMTADAVLRQRLSGLLDACTDDGAPSIDALTGTMEAMAMTDRYYTPEQQETLARRRNELGAGGMRAAEQAWAQLIADADAERAAGTDPADPRMQAIAGRWRELIEQFTGGDPGIHASLGRMYRERGVEQASRGTVSGELMDYMGQALAVSGR